MICRKYLVVLCLVLPLCLGACQRGRSYEQAVFVSRVEPEDCFLCGSRADWEARAYWGQENVGILSLNTFEFTIFSINRYDNENRLIEEATGCMATQSGAIGGSRYDASYDPDRGYGRVTLTLEDAGIDAAALESHLCDDCLAAFSAQYFEEENVPELALLDFAGQTVTPLRERVVWFGAGNYGVSCRYEETDQLSLLFFYCPPRYGGSASG